MEHSKNNTPIVSRQFLRTRPDGSISRGYGFWQDMAEPKTWEFLEQLLPNYDNDTGVNISNDLSCIIDGVWSRRKFNNYYPEFKGYSMEKLREALEETDAQLYIIAEEYLEQAVKDGEIEVRELINIEYEGMLLPLLQYRGKSIFPLVTTYKEGLGSPIAIQLYSLTDGEPEYYGNVTVNIPGAPRSAGCQFIDTNNNDDKIVDWLEENGFGIRTGKHVNSGFCNYPEFNFYSGEQFRKYRAISEKLDL